MYYCSKCNKLACTSGDSNNYPKTCPSHQFTQEQIDELYNTDDNMKLAYNSALVEAEGYCNKTRLEETIDFMNKCGYQKIGLAFCMGLKEEALILTDILEHKGFEIHSVICKTGGFAKRSVGIKDNEKIKGQEDNAMCNPIGQALLLNDEKVDFTIIFGLCVGHDTLLIKHIESPCTVLVVKDRVLCHNPIGAIYQASAYYKKKLYK